MQQQLEISQAGHDALKQRTVNTRERQIMLLANGGSSSQKMLYSMGTEAQEVVQQLLAKGLLRPRGDESASSIFADSVHDLSQSPKLSTFDQSVIPKRLLADSEEADTHIPRAMAVPQLPVNGAQQDTRTPNPKADTTSLHSLRASKIYVAGLLKITEQPEARHWAQRLLDSVEEEDAQVLFKSINYLRKTHNPTLVKRIVEKLHTLLPQELLPMLEKQTISSTPDQSH